MSQTLNENIDALLPSGKDAKHHHHDDCAKGNLEHHMAIAHEICAKNNERFTQLRAHIFELILTADGAVKAYDLLGQISPKIGSPKPPTVYRAIEFLSKLGLIHRIEALNAYVACAHSHEQDQAEFFVCKNCSAVEESHGHDHIGCAPNGFIIQRSVVEHYGLCAACQSLGHSA